MIQLISPQQRRALLWWSGIIYAAFSGISLAMMSYNQVVRFSPQGVYIPFHLWLTTPLSLVLGVWALSALRRLRGEEIGPEGVRVARWLHGGINALILVAYAFNVIGGYVDAAWGVLIFALLTVILMAGTAGPGWGLGLGVVDFFLVFLFNFIRGEAFQSSMAGTVAAAWLVVVVVIAVAERAVAVINGQTLLYQSAQQERIEELEVDLARRQVSGVVQEVRRRDGYTRFWLAIAEDERWPCRLESGTVTEGERITLTHHLPRFYNNNNQAYVLVKEFLR